MVSSAMKMNTYSGQFWDSQFIKAMVSSAELCNLWNDFRFTY